MNFTYWAQRLARTEWGENWRAWPHCNGQGGCWMHISDRWCACGCPWCRLAAIVRRSQHKHGSMTGRQARKWRAGENWREA